MLRIETNESKVVLTGDLVMEEIGQLLRDPAFPVIGGRIPGNLPHRVIDLSGIDRIDSAGAALLDEFSARGNFLLVGMKPEVEKSYQRFGTGDVTLPPSPASGSFLEKTGDKIIRSLVGTGAFLLLLSDSIFWTFIGLFDRKGQRKGSFIQQSVIIGVEAFPVVGLTAFLVGLIMAVLSAGQLRQFGANIFVADLVTVAMAREMGPIMTAIIMAGRSGSAIASEIATMAVTEELDALKTMGINPVRFVIVPKIWAISLTLPLLTLLSVIIGTAGGIIVGVLTLDISVAAFLREASTAVSFADIITGMGKSVVFAWLIVITASYFGMQAKGGAEGVGRVTTSSVVTSIFLVIIADSLMALILYL